MQQTHSLNDSRREQFSACGLIARMDLKLELEGRKTSLQKHQQEEAGGTIAVTSHQSCCRVNTTRTSCIHAAVNHTSVTEGKKAPWNSEELFFLSIAFYWKNIKPNDREKKVMGSGAIISEESIKINSELRIIILNWHSMLLCKTPRFSIE